MLMSRYTGRGKRRGSLAPAGIAACLLAWLAALGAFLGWLA